MIALPCRSSSIPSCTRDNGKRCDTIFSSGYSFLIEMLYRCQKQRFSVGETPIVFVNRLHGASKISRTEIFRAMYTVVRLRWPALPWGNLAAAYRRRQAAQHENAGGQPK